LDLESFMKGSSMQNRNLNRDVSELSHDPHGGGGGSIPAAVFGIIKAMVGPAILYLPHGFATSGYAFAVLVVIIITAMFLYGSDRLLESWRYEMARDTNTPLPSAYGSISDQESAPSLMKKKEKIKAHILSRTSLSCLW